MKQGTTTPGRCKHGLVHSLFHRLWRDKTPPAHYCGRSGGTARAKMLPPDLRADGNSTRVQDVPP